ncbi:MAG: 16S rRNA (guanine(966)-N(2))-methyltransferase RsmD [Clostridia bacterium]|nr:16S rRNA (guanine(966)-N(2))-methyltransferase RsmD [Clostridia bacterium]
MRVISGSARGKKLISAEGLDVRPTLDRVKESVFNMIAFDLPDAIVLDLFSGSGALGIEALSRGAKHAVFVDNNSTSLSVTKQNLEATRLSDLAETVQSDSIRYLKTTSKTFDIILIDPPYQAGLYDEVLSLIYERNLLNPDGLMIVESALDDAPQIPSGRYSEVRDKKYGKVKILLIKA